MTLIEVIIATAVLAIGLMTALGQFGTLNQLRQISAETSTAKTIVFALAERFQGCRWDIIGSSDAPWSLLRAEPGTVTTPVNGPLMDDASLPADEQATRGLQTLGLALAPSRLRNLRVYVEFYRAIPATDADGNNLPGSVGIMDGGGATYADPSAFRERFRFDFRWEAIPSSMRSAVATNRANHLLSTDTLPSAQVGENDPIAIRILATWDDARSGEHAFATVTARKR